MAFQLNTVSVLDFLKGMRKTAKSKESKIKLGDITYWETTWEKLDEAAREPGMRVTLTGTETVEDGDGEATYATFLADLEASGDLKKLAIRI